MAARHGALQLSGIRINGHKISTLYSAKSAIWDLVDGDQIVLLLTTT